MQKVNGDRSVIFVQYLMIPLIDWRKLVILYEKKYL